MTRVSEGTVIAVRPRKVRVDLGDRTVDAFVRGSLKSGRRRQTHVIAVNDRVNVATQDRRGAVVEEILPRRNQVSRVDPGSRRNLVEHVLAVNLDWLVVVMSLAQPILKTRTLDRLLVLGEINHVPPLIVLNKLDLEDEPRDDLEAYAHIGYPVLRVSALQAHGCDALLDRLRDRVSLVIGPSGVGKSSLLNAILPGLELDTQPISESTGKGVHTTTRVEYHPLPGGGAILDSPGIRSVQPWGLDPESLRHAFPEFHDAPTGPCQFRDCQHRAEPSCAVRDAVERGDIVRFRYESYLKLLEDLEQAQEDRTWDLE